jgi:transposase
MTSAYPITLSDDQYSLCESLLPPPAPCGRPREVDLKRVLESMLYILVTGCAWRLLTHDYPPYSTVYYYFRQWRDQGV